MNRRFVNLVVANYRSKMHALHRVDASKHLFYPSTAEAEAAAHAREKENNNGGGGGGGGGGKPKPLRIEMLRRLPAPITGFESSPTTDPNRVFDSWDDDMFVLLHGPSGRGGEPGRILHANRAGHVTLYDADSRSVVSVPDLAEPKGYAPIPFAIAGAAGEEESLYVMRSAPVQPARNDGQRSLNFEVLDFGSGGSSSRRRGYCLGRRSNLQWQPLPPPPMADGRFDIPTVLDGGQTICVSSSQSDVTFCFDAVSREWWRSGDWRLPFQGTAEYVPELGTWLGFSPAYPHHLCATDLSGVASAGPRAEEPALQHIWEDFYPPPDERTSLVLNNRFPGIVHITTKKWWAPQLHLVNMGSGRLCIAKVFEAEETVSLSCYFDDFETRMDSLTVLVGVEVVRGGEGEGLRMIKHKSKRFVFPDDDIKWVL